MRRLLAEGMDAGLSGFSVQRLGPDSTQADFDGSPMVTDTMCDEDILNLARVLRERDEGFVQITQATGHIKDDLAFLERLAAEANRPILHNAIAPARHNPKVHQRSLAWLKRCREKGLPIFGQTGDAAHRFRVHARKLESLRREPRVAHRHDRQQRRKNRQDERSGAARGDQARARRGEQKLEAIQAGVGGADSHC